jgi:hypothetical protein
MVPSPCVTMALFVSRAGGRQFKSRAPIQKSAHRAIQSPNELTGDFRSLLREVARSPKEAYEPRVAGLLPPFRCFTKVPPPGKPLAPIPVSVISVVAGRDAGRAPPAPLDEAPASVAASVYGAECNATVVVAAGIGGLG